MDNAKMNATNHRLTRDQHGILWTLWNIGPQPVDVLVPSALIAMLSRGLVNVSHGEARIAGTDEAWSIAKSLSVPPMSIAPDRSEVSQ